MKQQITCQDYFRIDIRGKKNMITTRFRFFKQSVSEHSILYGKLLITYLIDMMNTRILQVTMLRAKFGRIRIRANLLQRFDNTFGHFDNKICYKIDKMNCEFFKRNRRQLLDLTGDSATEQGSGIFDDRPLHSN